MIFLTHLNPSKMAYLSVLADFVIFLKNLYGGQKGRARGTIEDLMQKILVTKRRYLNI